MTLQTTPPPHHLPPPFCTILVADHDDLEPLCRYDDLRDFRQRDFVAAAIDEGRCWVAFFDEVLAGYGIFQYQFHDCGVIHRIFVRPEFRRRGIGRALVDYFSDACSSPRLQVTVPQTDLPMLELVRQRGFALSGVVEAGALDEAGEEGRALILAKDLLTATPAAPGRGLQ